MCVDVESFSKLKSEALQLGKFITGDLLKMSSQMMFLFVYLISVYLLLHAIYHDRPRDDLHSYKSYILMITK